MTEAMPFLQKYDITFLRPLPIRHRDFLVFSKIFPAPIDNVTLLCYYRNSVTEHCYATPHGNLLWQGGRVWTRS